ncbi:hypothetical protein ABZ922_04000 [Streptomyces shenzhenensis]
MDGSGGRGLAGDPLDAAPLVVEDRELAAWYGVLAAAGNPRSVSAPSA